MSHGIGLTLAEIRVAFDNDTLRDLYPPILSPERCAPLFGVSVNTVYYWLERGQLQGAHRRRGKRQFIWRDRAIHLTLNDKLARAQAFHRRRHGFGIGLTDEEIQSAFANQRPFGPILSPELMAELLGLSRSTMYFWIQQGRFADAVTRRGKRNFFWRNRAIVQLFEGPEWGDHHE